MNFYLLSSLTKPNKQLVSLFLVKHKLLEHFLINSNPKLVICSLFGSLFLVKELKTSSIINDSFKSSFYYCSWQFISSFLFTGLMKEISSVFLYVFFLEKVDS